MTDPPTVPTNIGSSAGHFQEVGNASGFENDASSAHSSDDNKLSVDGADGTSEKLPPTSLLSFRHLASTIPGTGSDLSSTGFDALQHGAAALQSTNAAYRDFSNLPDDSVLGHDPPAVAAAKEPPFPVKLHGILSSSEFRDLITWLPHGRSWRILKPKAFEEKVVPLYFRHAKYASFMRQVNGWGFKRMTQGPDHNSYYHELFLRGLPHLCVKMRRPARSKNSNGTTSDGVPDFYSLSMVAPLPDASTLNARSGILAGSSGQSELGVMVGGMMGMSGMFGGQIPALATCGQDLGLPGAFDSSLLSNPFVTPGALQHRTQGQFQQGSNTIIQQPHETHGIELAANNGTENVDRKNAGTDVGNIDLFQQRMKERTDLLQQLRNAMDGGSNNGNLLGSAPLGQSPVPQNSAGIGNFSALDPSAFFSNGPMSAQHLQQMMTQLQAGGTGMGLNMGIGMGLTSGMNMGMGVSPGLSLGMPMNMGMSSGMNTGMIPMNMGMGQFPNPVMGHLGVMPSFNIGNPGDGPFMAGYTGMNNQLYGPAMANPSGSLGNINWPGMQNQAALPRLLNAGPMSWNPQQVSSQVKTFGDGMLTKAE